MKLKYVGPKPIISEHGISFKDGKEDKHIYLIKATQILNSINHNYTKGRVYSHDILNDEISEDDIHRTIITFMPNLEKTIEEEIESYKKYLKDEIENLESTHKVFTKIELTACENNLKIMQDYRIQRAINKVYYMHIIEIIAQLIKKHRIKDISAPFNERFWHILQTIQGELSRGKESVKSVLYKDDNNMIDLNINIY